MKKSQEVEEDLTSTSEQYVQTSNKKLMIVGIVCAVVFLIGVVILLSRGKEQRADAKQEVSGASDVYSNIDAGETDNFGWNDEPPKVEVDDTNKLKVTPENLRFDQVVLGTTAEGALTVTPTKGRVTISDIQIDNLNEDSFKIDSKCVKNDIYTPDTPCQIFVSWKPQTARTIQTNLTIKWRDEQAGANGKPVVVSISAMAIDTSLCGVCDDAPGGGSITDQLRQKGRLVLGPDGKPIGYADENGVVYGLDGKRIGMLRSDGTVVDDQGYVIGIAESSKIALGPDGSVIGTILPDGRVIDKDGNLIGYALPDGTIIDLKGNVIGSAPKTGPAVDKFGKVIGNVLPDGRVVDENGNVIGYLNPDGTIVDSQGNIIGSVLPQGAIVDVLGNALGIVMPNGSAVDKEGNVFGRVLQNGVVIGTDNTVKGHVVKEGLAIGSGCKMIGKVGTDGSVMMSNKQVGRMNSANLILDMGGNPIGSMIQEGVLIDWQHHVVGKIDKDGQPVDFKGSLLGCLLPNGYVVDDREEIKAGIMPHGSIVGERCGFAGRVMPDGSVVNNGEYAGYVVPDGSVVKDNVIVGKVADDSKVAVAPGCKILGYANVDGDIFAPNSEVVGCLTSAGEVYADNVVLGKTLKSMSVISADGRSMGLIDGNGHYVDKNGQYMGCMDPEQVAIKEYTNPVAFAVPTGGVLDANGEAIGWVMPDGQVKNSRGDAIGRALADNDVIDLSNKKVARVVPKNGLAVKKACELAGKILEDGRVVDSSFTRTAFIKSNDSLFDLNATQIGRVAYAKYGMDDRNKFVGTVDSTGHLVDAAGQQIACLRPDNVFVDKDDKFFAVSMATGLAVNPLTELYAHGDSIGKALNIQASDFIGTTLAVSLIQDDHKKITGGIIPAGIDVLDDVTNAVIGKLLPDGTALDLQKKYLGRLKMPDGKIVDKSGKVVGKILFGLRQVIDENGKIIGTILPDGTVIDENGKVIGKMRADGKVVDNTGKIIGEELPVGMPVLGSDGKVLGYVGFNGKIVDADGNIVNGADGKPLQYKAHGVVVDSSGNLVGFILREGLAISYANEVLGTISSDGVVKNKTTGEATKSSLQIDGRINDEFGADIGRGILNATPLSKQGTALGTLSAEGKVVSSENKELGFVTFDRAVLDDKNKQIGQIVGLDNIIEGNDCHIIGKINSAGRVVHVKTGKDLGSVSFDGNALTNNSVKIGKMVITGPAIGFDGKEFGKVISTGEVLAPDGKRIGCFGENGEIYSAGSNYIMGVSGSMKYAIDYFGNVTARIVGNKYSISPKNDTMVGSFDGENVIGSNNQKIGRRVFSGRRVIDKNGRIIGTVMPTGEVFDNIGRQIGKSTSIMKALTNDNKFLGRIVPIGEECKDKNEVVVGKVHFDGQIIDENQETLGRLLADGTAISNSNGFLCSISKMTLDSNLNGTPIYDENGNLIGYADENGVVRDLNGEVIGHMRPDGTVVSTDGTVIGYAGTPVYDEKGNLIGYADRNGVVRDLNGNVIGQMRPDGTVVDKNGKVIGHGGTPVYDEHGNVIGFSDKDGIVRDFNGRVIGQMRPDGTVVDKSGKVIGFAGKPVYDANGNLIGYVGKDGLVRDKNGKIIGRVRPDGTVVDMKGNVIGFTADKKMLDAGMKPLYDKYGNLIGFVDKDGNVFDKSGKRLGKLRSDGSIVDDDGNVIAHAVLNGTPIFDEKGNLIGFTNGDGKLYDADGNVIGKVLADGTVLDNDGNVLRKGAGSTANAKQVKFAVDRDGKFMGVVGDDGFVRDASGQIVGQVNENGDVLDLNGNIVGSVKEGEALLDENGNLVGVIMADGTVVDLNGKVLGKINSNGEIVDSNGNVIGVWADGKFTPAKVISKKKFAFGKDGKFIGYVQEDGTVLDEDGNIIGYVDEDGNVVSSDGTIIGSVQNQDDKEEGGLSVYGKFDPDGYRYRGRDSNQSSKGERYDPVRIKELRAKQLAYRKMIRPGISGGVSVAEEKKALLRKQHKATSWDDVGQEKNVSSYRVNMDHMILADKAIPAVLARPIDSQNPVPASAVVERNIYSESGRKIIIPAGSRIIGELQNEGGSNSTQFAVKLVVNWTRLIRPDGAAFTFDDGVSGDSMGRGGIASYVDLQLFKRYAYPLLSSTLTSGITWAMASNSSGGVDQNGNATVSERAEASKDARKQFTSDLQDMTKDLFDMFTNSIKPVTYVPAGTRITVYANSDLWLRSEVEDENSEGYQSDDVLINERDPEMRGTSDANDINRERREENSVTRNDGTDSTAQQQQLYYNNYQGQPQPNQGTASPRPGGSNLVGSTPPSTAPKPPTATKPATTQESIDEAPELF